MQFTINSAAVICFILFVCMLIAKRLRHNTFSLFPTLIANWSKLGFCSITTGIILQRYFLENHYLILCILIGVLIFILVETILLWMKISSINYALSQINEVNKEIENAWSCDKNAIKLKHNIEKLGLKKAQAYESFVSDIPSAKSTAFDSSDKKIRLTVSFLHGEEKSIATTALSITQEGKFIITTNYPNPVFPYPDTWYVQQYPMKINPIKIFKSHKKYIDSIDEDIAPITESPLNLEKRTSEEQEIFARKAGFIHNKADVNDYGLLTNEALFWFWINSIKLDYFPFLYK